MTHEQNFRFRSLLSNVINAAITGESQEHQLAHEDHLRNYMFGLLEEKDAEIERLHARQIPDSVLVDMKKMIAHVYAGPEEDGYMSLKQQDRAIARVIQALRQAIEEKVL